MIQFNLQRKIAFISSCWAAEEILGNGRGMLVPSGDEKRIK